MFSEIVIDTNVLVHASNPPEEDKIPEHGSYYEHYYDASSLVDMYIDNVCNKKNHIALCVDDEWDVHDWSKNKSQIVHEYWEHVIKGAPGKLGSMLLIILAHNDLIKAKQKWPQIEGGKGIIEKYIRKNQTDKIFVGVTYNTDSQTMVSNDEDDFPDRIRQQLHSELGINIFCSDQQCEIIDKFFSK